MYHDSSSFITRPENLPGSGTGFPTSSWIPKGPRFVAVTYALVTYFSAWVQKSCRNPAFFVYLRERTPRPLQKRVLFPNHLGRGYIFASHVFPRTFRWAKCQAPLPGIQSLMMSCANGWGRLYTSCGKWPRRTASICLFRFQRISTTLGGSCTIFYQIYCSWIQSCGIRNSKIHE